MLTETSKQNAALIHCLVDINSIRPSPFDEADAHFFKQITLKINKQRFVRGKRFLARTICRIFPFIAKLQYDIHGLLDIKARVVLDNFHDYWFSTKTIEIESCYRKCINKIFVENIDFKEFTYVDIGGNTGIVAAITAAELRKHHPEETCELNCVVIEPQDALISRLATNLKWNLRNSKTTLFHCALGEKFDEVSIAVNGNNRGGSKIGKPSYFRKTVQMAPLLNVLELSNTIKIDLLERFPIRLHRSLLR